MHEDPRLLIPPKMTVRQARKQLGRKYSHLDDDQIREVILTLTLIARSQLEKLGSKK